MAATNRAFRAEPNTEHGYDHITLFNRQPFEEQRANPVQRANPDYQDDNRRQQPDENIIATSRCTLIVVTVLLSLSFLATVATMILTVTTARGTEVSTRACPGYQEPSVCAEVTQHLIDLKKELRSVKVNLTEKRVFHEVKQQLTELKEEIMAMKVDRTAGERVFDGVYKDCAHAHQTGKKISGLYQLDPDGQGVFIAYCDQKTSGGGWTVFQKRHDGSVDFYKGWNAYKRGFGNLNGDFWLGLDNIYRLTQDGNKKIRFDLALHNETAFAEYNLFAVNNETDEYRLIVGGYSGTAGDSFTYHRYQKFTTKDRDNDALSAENCAIKDHGAWWYKDCYNSNLNAEYLNGQVNGQGMVWFSWKKDYVSVTRSQMKIRPNRF